jgi:hypothetical protein
LHPAVRRLFEKVLITVCEGNQAADGHAVPVGCADAAEAEQPGGDGCEQTSPSTLPFYFLRLWR